MVLAARTNPALLSCLTSLRTILATAIQPVIPITADMDNTVAFPMAAWMNITSSSWGTLMSISANLIITSSTLSEASPAAVPYTTAVRVDIKVAATPIKIEILPP